MISVPQILGIVTGFGVVVGAISTWTIISYTSKRRRFRVKIAESSSGSKLYAPVLNKKLEAASKAIRWYSPAFSPKDVPRFYDVSSFTEDPALFRLTIDVFVEFYNSFPVKQRPTCIIGCDARGFILGPPIAMELNIPFVLLRKNKKNPGVLVESTGYSKEYAEKEEEKMCLRLGAIKPGDRAAVVDDLLATGGTALASLQLLLSLRASCHSVGCVVALEQLDAVTKIRKSNGGAFKDVPIFSMFSGATLGEGLASDPKDWKLKSRVVPLADAPSLQAHYNLR